jgi:hypothetical protein
VLRSGPFSWALHLHRQDRSRYSDCDIYPPAIGWSIEFIIISSVPDQDSSDDYLEIGISAYGNSIGEGRLIFMVAPNGIGRTIVPADISPLGDQNRPMLERPMMG